MISWIWDKLKGQKNFESDEKLQDIPIPKQTVNVLVGYMPYTSKDFENYFEVPAFVAEKIANDYASLLDFKDGDGFGAQVRMNPRNGEVIGQLCSTRYDIERKTMNNITHFYMSVAISREKQVKMAELQVEKTAWMESGAKPFCHAGMDGKKFNPQIGIKLGGSYVLPGVTLGCKCNSRPIF